MHLVTSAPARPCVTRVLAPPVRSPRRPAAEAPSCTGTQLLHRQVLSAVHAHRQLLRETVCPAERCRLQARPWSSSMWHSANPLQFDEPFVSFDVVQGEKQRIEGAGAVFFHTAAPARWGVPTVPTVLLVQQSCQGCEPPLGEFGLGGCTFGTLVQAWCTWCIWPGWQPELLLSAGQALRTAALLITLVLGNPFVAALAQPCTWSPMHLVTRAPQQGTGAQLCRRHGAPYQGP